MISVSDHQLRIVAVAADLLPVEARGTFLRRVVAELRGRCDSLWLLDSGGATDQTTAPLAEIARQSRLTVPRSVLRSARRATVRWGKWAIWRVRTWRVHTPTRSKVAGARCSPHASRHT
jgi:hypothetical protein